MSTFLARDIAFAADGDLLVAPTGDLQVAHDEDVMRQDILDRLASLPGELPAHPAWGCRIKTLLGAPDTPRTRMLALRYLREALEDESRVEDASIRVQQIGFTPEEKVFQIRFALAGQDKLQELVWGLGLSGPFTVHQGEIVP
ncbi:MAG: GPW/gp25 family protein [bacterium]|nr:GPW/gp25 family protein [bacterium]